jgi:hypothetical protein
MITLETITLFLGLGFSLLVYALSIRPAAISSFRKAAYFILSTIGITGMVWLSGIVIAHFLRKMQVLP